MNCRLQPNGDDDDENPNGNARNGDGKVDGGNKNYLSDQENEDGDFIFSMHPDVVTMGEIF